LGKTYFVAGFLQAMGSVMSSWGFTHHHPLKGVGVVRNKTVVFTNFSWEETKFLNWYLLQQRKNQLLI
jgi:hypothetical protein